MDMHSHKTHEDPIEIHHPEEEEHQDSGASKMMRKVKEKAKKIKNSLTKSHSHEHDHDVEEEDDEDDVQDPEVHGAPVYESSAVRGGVTGQPDSRSHLGGTNVPAPEEIIPPGTKAFPVEPEPLRDASYGHGHGHEVPSHPLRVADMSEREESREDHQMPMHTPASLLSGTEDVPRSFAPGEDEFLGGQRKVNIETPKRLEEDPAAPGGGSGYLSGESNYQSKVTDPTHEGGVAGVPGIAESLGRMKVTDESPDQKSGLGFEKDFPTRSHEFESGIGKDSTAGFGGDAREELMEDITTRSHELYDHQKPEYVATNSSTGSGAGLGKDRSHEFGVKEETGIDKNSPTGYGGDSGAGTGRDFLHELGLKNETKIENTSPMGFGEGLGSGVGEDSQELGVKNEYGIGKDSRVGGHGYGEESEAKSFGSDLPTGTHDQFSPDISRPKEDDQFSPDISRPKEVDAFESKREETQDVKPSTYTEKFASATSTLAGTALAAKNAVASRLGYSGENTDTGVGGQHESPVVDETPRSSTTEYGQKGTGPVAEKLSPVFNKVKETGSAVMTKLPLSGGGSGAETQQGGDKGVTSKDYLAEKLRPGEDDKALSEVIAEKLNLGGGAGENKTTGTGDNKTTTTKEVEVTVEKIPSDHISEEKEFSKGNVEEVKEGEAAGGEGMVGKLKGAVTSWFGGKTEEVTPKSPASVEESPQSLGSTVGTTGFKDSSGAVPRGPQQSEN